MSWNWSFDIFINILKALLWENRAGNKNKNIYPKSTQKREGGGKSKASIEKKITLNFHLLIWNFFFHFFFISFSLTHIKFFLRLNIEALYVLTSTTKQRFEFIFTDYGTNPAHFASIFEIYKIYQATALYRELKLRSAILTDGQLNILPQEQVYNQLSGIYNLSSDQVCDSRLFLFGFLFNRLFDLDFWLGSEIIVGIYDGLLALGRIELWGWILFFKLFNDEVFSFLEIF